jgi:hypothetical protein
MFSKSNCEGYKQILPGIKSKRVILSQGESGFSLGTRQ